MRAASRLDGPIPGPVTAWLGILSFLTLWAIATPACGTDIDVPPVELDTWYVRSSPPGDPSAQSGSQSNPFATLAEVEASAGEGDTIVVLPSDDGAPLAGGIRLKPGQTLRSETQPVITVGVDGGPDEGECVIDGNLPIITSSTGHAVQLADDTTVAGLHILGATHSGIWGEDVGGVTIENNLLEESNVEEPDGPEAIRDEALLSRLDDFHGVSALAAIHLRASGAATLTPSTIRGNCVRRSAMGISLVAVDDARATFTVTDNVITDIQSSLSSAVQLTTMDNAYVETTVEGLFADRLGFPAQDSNSDKIRVMMEHQSEVHVTVRDYVARNSTAMTGPSSTGIELALGAITRLTPEEEMTERMVLDAVIERARIHDMPSAGIQLVDTASNSDVSLIVSETEIVATSGEQGHNIALYKLPFFDSLAQGGSHTIILEANQLTEASDGRHNLFLGVYGTLDSLSMIVHDNALTDATGDGLHLELGATAEVLFEAADNDILAAGQYGISLAAAQGAGDVSLDLGGGPQSAGGNRIIGAGMASARVDAVSAVAENNWWGDIAGPVIEELNGGTLDADPWLTEDPRP